MQIDLNKQIFSAALVRKIAFFARIEFFIGVFLIVATVFLVPRPEQILTTLEARKAMLILEDVAIVFTFWISFAISMSGFTLGLLLGATRHYDQAETWTLNNNILSNVINMIMIPIFYFLMFVATR